MVVVFLPINSLFSIVLASATMGALGEKHLMLQLLLNLHYFCPLLLGAFRFLYIHIYKADADGWLVYVHSSLSSSVVCMELLLLSKVVNAA